ncbi:ATP-binding protein [Aliinostoc sp. HNIBRCY26]|uniref:sensor histidine kinase n=1 Tax=Aliinostoc sp. HNIBRCY26 TaxID=3418997 RepID=UPI003D0592C5
MQRFFRRLSLSQKIVIPLLTICLSVFLCGLFVLGHWFAESLERNARQDIAVFSKRVEQDLQYEQEALETQIELITNRGMLTQALEKQDQILLMQILIPLKSVLKLDLIKVIDAQGQILIDLRSSSLYGSKLIDQAIANSVSNGAHLIDLVNVEGGEQVLQVVTNSIKSPSGILGGMIIGRKIDDTLVQKIAAGSSKHLIIQTPNYVVATTLLPTKRQPWELPHPNLPVTSIEIEKQQYLAKSIEFSGVSQSLNVTVLYPIAPIETAKWRLWEHLGILYILGSGILAMVGFFIARTITRPLQALTQVAQRVTQESDFDIQATVMTEDEVGILAISLNRLIKQVKILLEEQYENNKKLESYNQTLEKKVEERTQALQQKNVALKDTLRELKNTQSQLVQQEKMSSLGQLVAGIAHEINNPVNFIYGNLKYTEDYTQNLLSLLELYQKHYPYPAPEIQNAQQEADMEYLIEDLPKILSSMKIGASRIREIVLSLRIFSRLDEAEFKTADLHQGIDSTLLILQHRIKAQGKRPEIKIEKHYNDIPDIQCFAGQLNQVFMNILANAIDALEEAFDQGLCPEPLIRITSSQEGSNVVIAIADNGTGIPEEVLSKLFDPFFTTKPVGKGTGMGLSISYQIITEKHGGLLKCISTPGKGTEFFIAIPIR